MSKINPFTPNSPIYGGMFVGRGEELDAINRSLTQTKNANPTHLLFLGERGIGKTSLLNAAQIFASGNFDWEDQKHNFLTVRTSLNENISLSQFSILLKGSLEREIGKEFQAFKWTKKAWDFISRIEAAGITLSKNQSLNDAQLIQDFIYSLCDTVNLLTDKKIGKDGLVILIDETDKASRELQLGSFLKNLSETLISEGVNKILFILTGLPNTRDILLESHESSLRLFHEFILSPLSAEETARVIQNGLNKSKEQGVEIQVDAEAQKLIHQYSEGYPHFVQQIGYSVFEFNKDEKIDEADVISGFFSPDGALKQIGLRYYEKLFYKDIKVDSQREILNIMSDNWTNWVTREQIRKDFKGKEVTLTNGIRALIDKGIIIPRIGVRGQYKLQWGSFAFWIKNHKKNQRI